MSSSPVVALRTGTGTGTGDATPRSLVVEFLGLPGSGKSTLSHRVAERLGADGATVTQVSYRLAHGSGPGLRRLLKTSYVVRELIAHPVQSLRALDAMTVTRQRSIATRARLFFNWLLVRGLTRAARRRCGVHLLDQGVLQAVWSIALEDTADGAEVASALLAVAGVRSALPDVLVVVEASLGVVARRLQERHRHDSRIERGDGGELMLQRGRDLVERLRGIAARNGVQVLATPNDADDPDRAAATIAGALRREAGTVAVGVRAV